MSKLLGPSPPRQCVIPGAMKRRNQFVIFPDPAVAFALGGGGRYDELLGRFGQSRPACGAGLDVQRVHVAQIEEERGS